MPCRGYDVLGLLLQHIHFCHNLLQGSTTTSCKKAKTFISTVLELKKQGPPNTTTKTSIFKLRNSTKNTQNDKHKKDLINLNKFVLDPHCDWDGFLIGRKMTV
jgi:hypothetical protein